jgi:acyl-CoA thioester hydrolase
MTLTYTATYPVRYYECDSYGHVNHANYVRYMVEAAFGAAASVGYDETRLRQMQVAWFAREHDITYLRPLYFGDTVTVRTWVADFRRVRSLRQYELSNQHGELVATAQTDWIYVNTKSQYPTSIPPEAIAAFHPHGAPEVAPRRDPFPDPAPYAPVVYKHRAWVEWRDVDPQRHVNNAAYLSYIENGVMEMARVRGWPAERLEREGFGIVARQYRIEYLRPAVLDDELEVWTWVSDKKRATAVRHYEIRRANSQELLVRARALWVWVDRTTGLPIRIPPAFEQDFADNFTPASS